MEQSHAKFNHLSMKSDYSANQVNVDELDEHITRESLIVSEDLNIVLEE